MGIGDVRGLNPDSQIDTPWLDEMCNRGIAFTDAHASSALSTPSRYSILTGRYNWRSTKKGGVLGVMSPPMITTGRNTIADMFRAYNYTTAAIGNGIWGGIGHTRKARRKPSTTSTSRSAWPTVPPIGDSTISTG